MFKDIVSWLQIGGMISLGHRDRFPRVSALVCTLDKTYGK